MEKRAARILVVDDEAAIRGSLLAYLGDQGYDADGAASAEQALELTRQRRYDLLIVDLRLPGMNGEQLIQRLNRSERPPGFLIHTGSTDFRLSAELRRAGLREHHVFAKPLFDLQQLLQGIEQRLARAS